MNHASAKLFDNTALPSSLGTSDADVLVDFYEMFLQTTQESWNELDAGKKTPDFKRIRHTAHKLKSSSASMGALALAQSLKELELAATEGVQLHVIKHTEQTRLVLEATMDMVRQELISLEQVLARATG
jgi:HPt (histidine-containing phosphotransfer) domain-containing protein